jgi:EcsC protein family
MDRNATTQAELTDYEARQVEKIAAWKASFPNPFGELFRHAAQPLADFVERFIPDRIALLSIDAAYNASDLSASENDIKIQAGVGHISELRHKPLQECDRLSRRAGTFAQGLATIEGALTGAGGIWTTLLDVPLLFTLCLRTIIKTGRCYGYALDKPADKAWILGALAVALSSTREKRTELTARLREIEDLLLEETQEQVLIEETASLLTQIELFEDIPVFGAATGALLNLSVAHRTDVTARHLFQERWLRDNGKLDVIEPAAEDGKFAWRSGWTGALDRAAWTTVYGLSYGAVLPFAVVRMMVRPTLRSSRSRVGDQSATDNGVVRGLEAQPA